MMDTEIFGDRAADAIEIARLARLDRLGYARQRKEAALRLGIPVGVLDEEVDRARRASERAQEETGTGGTDATEDETARRFAASYQGKIAFDHTQQKWFLWSGTRWQRDETDAVFFLVRDFCRAASSPFDRRDRQDHMRSIAFAGHVERAARSDPRLAVTHDVWDNDPWLLGVPGGVIDLRTRETLPPDPRRYISRGTSVAPAPPGADAPLWNRFLAEATGGDAEFVAFLQRLCGYFLTGHTNEEIIAFIYGEGGHGKGTFMRPVSQILHDYCVSIPIEAVTVNGRINLEYYRARMAGARLVTTVEPENGAQWSESAVKEISGNETPLSARHPYGRPFEFSPVCKIVAVGNHCPKLKGRTPAMERRLRIAPFDRKPRAPDPTLKERLVPEYPAVLRWMLDGCVAWQRGGLGTCAAVKAASEAYFVVQDSFRTWLDENCVLDPSLSVKPGGLLAAFNGWAKGNGRETMDAIAFAEIIDRTPPLKRGKWNGVRLVRGVGLKAEPEGGAQWQ